MATTTATKTAPFTTAEWASLKRLAKTIHTWNVDECNGAIQWEGDNEEMPRRYSADRWGAYTIPGRLCKNLEEQALESARKIAAKHGLSIYHQTDPRGIALYVYNAADSKGRIGELYSSIGKPVC
jgi:hypothetical protein